jgi:XTP/dITP diphosphohydrolase
MRLAIATGNPGKLREMRQLLRLPDVELVACATGVEENAPSYAGNALLKAEAAAQATGLAALGDDSGVEIEALDGFPGLHSARIAPTQDERNAIVLGRLAGHPRPWEVRFVCAVAVVAPGRRPRVFEGACDGELIPPRDGGKGFGYDPLFLVPELGRTFGELDDDEKHRWSHRGRAVRALLESDALGRCGG